MICASRTDGSVTAGGNTLIVRNRMLTFLSLFAFSPSDISPGNWERPISGHRSVLNFRPRCPWGCREVSEPLPDSWLPDKLKNLLVWPGWFFFLFCFFLLDRFCVWSAIVYLSWLILIDISIVHFKSERYSPVAGVAGWRHESASAACASGEKQQKCWSRWSTACVFYRFPSSDAAKQRLPITVSLLSPPFPQFWSSWEACLQFQSTGVFVRYK